MGDQGLRSILQHLRVVVGRAEAGAPQDRQLLKRFVTARDEQAFAMLVLRHGPLVWGVCWRALRHTQDAEDAFQATFLVLARKAHSVRWQTSVGNWLYSVAGHVAAEVRARKLRQRRHETPLAAAPEPAAPSEAAHELCALLDEELLRLPDKYRAPLLACYFEGCTTDQAARQLGWSQRTLERRLAQGRERLRARLSNRGFTLSGVLLAAVLIDGVARAAIPAGLATGTSKIVLAPGSSSALALALAEAVLKGGIMSKSKLLSLGLILGVTLGTGTALWYGLAPEQPAVPLGPPTVTTLVRQIPPVPRQFAQMAQARSRDVRALAERIWTITELVAKNHLEPPPRPQMILGAVGGLLKEAGAARPANLDQRAAAILDAPQLAALLWEFLPPEGPSEKLETALLTGLYDSVPGKLSYHTAAELKVNQQVSHNRYIGIGVQLKLDPDEKIPQIAIPLRHGVARRAGARPGDLLLEVNGQSTEGLSLSQVVERLRGEEGTDVTIQVRQPDDCEPRTLRMTRSVIPMDSLYGFRRAGDGWDYALDRPAGIGYVWVRSLKISTLHELRQLEQRLRGEDLRALVLDLRFSSGDGLFQHAALVADSLLDGGLMWTVRSTGNTTKAFHADRECLFRDWPLVVLTNEIRDNAQGMLLAALQDNRRAILVGEPTRNDGSIRTLVHLPEDQGALTVVNGRLERADRECGWPVQPDHTVPLTRDQRHALAKWQHEKDLPELPPGSDDRPPDDPQLARGLEVLRAALRNTPAARPRSEGT